MAAPVVFPDYARLVFAADPSHPSFEEKYLAGLR